MEALFPRASGQLMEDEGDVKTPLQKSVLEGLYQRGGGLEISAGRVVLEKLLWKTAGCSRGHGCADVRKQMCVSTA